MAVPIGIRAPGDDDSLRIANHAVVRWRAILAALSPIVGVHGVAALYRRTLFQARGAHAWLEVPPEADGMDLDHLRNQLARRSPDEAEAASAHAFLLFRDLLASLIGISLVERLLPPGSTPPPSGADAQDPSHD